MTTNSTNTPSATASNPPAAPLSPTQLLISRSTLISQGAEARLYLTPPHPLVPILLKHRFAKAYRHAALDSQLTRARVQAEARALVRAMRAGVRVPGVRCVDAREGVVGVEWVEGGSVRAWLGGGAEGQADDDSDDPETERKDVEKEMGITKGEIMRLVGVQVGRLHKADIVHGDLTTSNMLLRRTPTGTEVVIIDFGLSFTSSLLEDKAVDLYVLERAFASTHPDSEVLFEGVLASYASEVGKGWEGVRKRLEEVRLRGRKRSMVG